MDAAVAVGFALAVVYPDAGNLGGGGFMMLRMANGESHFLDFREEAPLRATANMYLDSSGKIIPEASTVGYLAVGVPGTVAGLIEAQRKFGKLTLRQVMAPAIQFAETRLCAQRGGSSHASRSCAVPVPGVATHLPTERKFLSSWRDLPPAGVGAHVDPDRDGIRGVFIMAPWRAHSRRPSRSMAVWLPKKIWRSTR